MAGILLTKTVVSPHGIHSKAEASGVTTATIVDSATVDVVEWVVKSTDSANSANVETAKVIAAHNGATVDYSVSSILRLGTPIDGLTYSVTFSGGNTLELTITSTTSVDVKARRANVL